MGIRIGHARINELGGVYHGTRGDQKQNIQQSGVDAGYDTTGEVSFSNFYTYTGGWSGVLRPLDPEIAEKIAFTMEQVCNNPYVGYNWGGREELNTLASQVNYDISKITTPCHCDCSSAVGTCMNAAGIRNSLTTTSSMIDTYQYLKNSRGEYYFELIKDYDCIYSGEGLRRGDILVKTGTHTAIVVGDGLLAPIINSVENKDSNTLTCNITIRALPGTDEGYFAAYTPAFIFVKYDSETVEAPPYPPIYQEDYLLGDFDDCYQILTSGENIIIDINRVNTLAAKASLIVTQYRYAFDAMDRTSCSAVSSIPFLVELIRTDTVIQVYYNNTFEDAKPHIYTDGTWKKYIPMIYYGGKWTEIRSILD